MVYVYLAILVAIIGALTSAYNPAVALIILALPIIGFVLWAVAMFIMLASVTRDDSERS